MKLTVLVTVLAAALLFTAAPMGTLAADSGFATLTETPVTEPESPQKPDEIVKAPVIVKFGAATEMAAQGADYYIHNDGITQGKYEATSGQLKLLYSRPVENGHPEYRIMPYFSNAGLTADHKYVRVTYKTDEAFHSELIFFNNKTGSAVTLENEASVSKGEWVRTDSADISSSGILQRFLDKRHATLGFNCIIEGAEFYLSEIAFFTSEKQAYEYYGDSPRNVSVDSVEMTFGTGGSGTTSQGENYGANAYDANSRALKITYAEKTNLSSFKYMAKIKFRTSAHITNEYRYVRVVYSAKNPDGVDSAVMYLRTDAQANVSCLVRDVRDTNGEFVISDTVCLSQYTADRFSGMGEATSRTHNSLVINPTAPGGEYYIRSLVFFKTREEAEAYVLKDDSSKITVEGVDIAEFTVVIPEDAPVAAKYAAEAVVDRIDELTGVRLPVKTDSQSTSKHEIIIGNCERELSEKVLGEPQNYGRYVSFIGNGCIVLNAEKAPILEICADEFVNNYLYGSSINVPALIELKGGSVTGTNNEMRESKYLKEFENVSDPVTVTDSFDSDTGLFTEENGESYRSVEGGTLNVSAGSDRLTYIHVYEPNAEISTKISVKSAKADSEVSLMLRYTSANAYVKAGYDFAKGEWFLENREGADFYLERLASKKAEFNKNTDYTLTFRADGTSLTLYVNGEKLLETDSATHVTPGRIAIFADNAEISVDDFKAVLLSGEGTVLYNVEHTALPDDTSLAGGTVIKMSDGTLRFIYSKTVNYISSDNGNTWTDAGSFIDTMGQPNIIRLSDGSFMQIGTSGDKVCAFISTDELKSFKKVGEICEAVTADGKFSAKAVNMNDKIFLSPTTGRILFSQNYEVFGEGSYNGMKVFCRFYYSDDNGETWTSSETDAWQIEGNTETEYFGECKILECADGTLRMYNSWNHYGCIVYSESTDGGKTWGPLVKMPEFICSRSSMQFVRDPYAENDHTYYMIWVYSPYDPKVATMTRSRLSLARSEDGKTWEYLGDLWRWESNYTGTGSHGLINHIVNPTVYVTEDSVIAGCGASERMHEDSAKQFHQQQRQHLWTVKKSTLPEGKTLNLFDDVKVSADYNDAVSFVTSEGLFNGTSATTFSPDVTMNRAMFVTVLGRLDGADVSAYSEPTFSDVAAGQWYTGYVGWAAAKGIVNGMGGGVYGINGAVTVEQACTVLYRYSGGKASDSGTKTTVADFADGGDVSQWAKEAVEWAVANGVYTGDNGKLGATSAASRATVATIFANYVKAFG